MVPEGGEQLAASPQRIGLAGRGTVRQTDDPRESLR